MRKVMVVGFLMVIFLLACSSTEDVLREDPNVQIFSAMHDGNIRYVESESGGSEDEILVELASTECPNLEAEEFTRSSFQGELGSLVVYTSGEQAVCMIVKPKEQAVIDYRPRSEAPEGVALVVDGSPINTSQVNNGLAGLPAGTRIDNTTLGAVLNRLINEELLRQRAQGMEVSRSELDSLKEEYILAAGLDEQAFFDNLASQGVSIEEFDRLILEQARMAKLLEERLLLDEVNVSEEAARDFYLHNTNQFVRSEQAMMRHLFVSSEQRSDEQLQSRLQLIARELEGSDFCELVREYSDDEKSKDECGVYVIPRGVISPELEYAAFNTPKNQTAMISTQDGVHFVQSLQVIPNQVVPYSEVVGPLQDSLRNSVMQQRLNLYLQLLRSDANIVVYMT